MGAVNLRTRARYFINAHFSFDMLKLFMLKVLPLCGGIVLGSALLKSQLLEKRLLLLKKVIDNRN